VNDPLENILSFSVFEATDPLVLSLGPFLFRALRLFCRLQASASPHLGGALAGKQNHLYSLGANLAAICFVSFLDLGSSSTNLRIVGKSPPQPLGVFSMLPNSPNIMYENKSRN
jgi:hypothetical protein